jgi:putative ABC transport system permease protein
MFDLDRWQEIYHTLRSNKLRTFLTAFGVFWGIFMLVIMLGAGKGLEKGVYDGMGGFSTNSFFVWTQTTTKPYKGYKKGRNFNFDIYDTRALREIPEIDVIAPRIQGWGNRQNANKVEYKNKNGSYTIMGDCPEYNLIDPVDMKYGRYINASDMMGQRKVVLLGKRVYEELFDKGENPIGKFIKVSGIYFQVIGVFKSQHKGGWADWQEQAVILPFSTLQKVYNLGNLVGWYAITVKPDINSKVVETKVKDLLRKRHDINPDDQEAIGSDNVQEQFIKIHGLFLGIGILVWVVGIGTLLAGVIGVTNIMLVVVRERTQIIGIQRAIGASPGKIISMVISESVVLTSIAGFMGLSFGVGVLELVGKMMGPAGSEQSMFGAPEIDFNVAFVALLIIVAAGIVAGFLPAKRAISIKPVDAIRTEI